MNKMKNGLFLLLIIGLFGCGSSTEEVETKDLITTGDWYLTADESAGYVNEEGDTMIAAGKYAYIFTDTFEQVAIVMTKDNRCIAIDKNEKELFEVYVFDNGPDYVQDGLYRIIQGDKMGYANEAGEIIIEPRFKCATPFSNKQARVAYECDFVEDGEHMRIENAKWIYIDTEGNEAAEMVD
jgi:hypothetical protein